MIQHHDKLQLNGSILPQVKVNNNSVATAGQTTNDFFKPGTTTRNKAFSYRPTRYGGDGYSVGTAHQDATKTRNLLGLH